MQLAKPDTLVPLLSIRGTSELFVVVMLLGLTMHEGLAQWPYQWPENLACREKYSESASGYREYLDCLVSMMPPLDLKKRELFGEQYDPKKYRQCRLDTEVRDTSCEPYRLRRRAEPEYWPYAGKVPQVKWPEAPKQSVYRKGMTPKEYFDALCKAEVGEFIYKTVDSVEGIYQIRPRLAAGNYELRDRYVLEDPYDYSEAEANRPAFQYVGSGGYKFFESPRITAAKPGHEQKYFDASFFVDPPQGVTVERYLSQPKKDSKLWGGVRKEFDTSIKSRFGYTWREIRRPMDRQLGVVGGELIVIDLTTNEILGFRRGFAHSGYVRNVPGGFQWEIAQMCPSIPNWTGGDLAPKFVQKILKPKPHVEGGSDGSK